MKNQEQTPNPSRPLAEKLFFRHSSALKDDVEMLLKASSIVDRIGQAERILLKPNLVTDSPPPVTTPVELVRQILRFLKRHLPDRQYLIAEGCGASEYDTWRPFRNLGYQQMAAEEGIGLIDLNSERTIRLERPDCRRFPQMYLPEILSTSFLISIPVLKAHSFSQVTLSLKNMMGLAPPSHYDAGSWKKSAFHHRLEEAILDLNRYRKPDFTLLDARKGLQDFHLGGRQCNPSPGLLLAGYDPVAMDAYGARILKKNPQNIGHIANADGVLGWMEPDQVVEV